MIPTGSDYHRLFMDVCSGQRKLILKLDPKRNEDVKTIRGAADAMVLKLSHLMKHEGVVLELLPTGVAVLRYEKDKLKPGAYLTDGQRSALLGPSWIKVIARLYPEIPVNVYAEAMRRANLPGCSQCNKAQAVDVITDNMQIYGTKNRQVLEVLAFCGQEFYDAIGQEPSTPSALSIDSEDLKDMVQPPQVPELETKIRSVLAEFHKSGRTGVLKGCPSCVYKHLAAAAAYFNESKVTEYRNHRALAVGELVLAEHESLGLTDINLPEDIRVERLAAMSDRSYIPGLLPLCDRAEAMLDAIGV